MAGMFGIVEGAHWATSSWTFYYVVERLAEDAGPVLGPHLRRISDNHLGALWLDDLEPAEQLELARLLTALPEIARRELRPVPEREPRAVEIEHIAALVNQHAPVPRVV